VARLAAAPGALDEPRASAALAAVLRFGEPRESEVEAQGATVLLRALPLAPGGERRGALVMVRDVTELRHRDRQLMGKDATIREIHHRVKNNLQTVAALLRLQARRVGSPQARAALEESVRRVASIALVHETLSQTLEGAVPFDEVADRVLAMCSEVAAPESRRAGARTGRFGRAAGGGGDGAGDGAHRAGAERRRARLPVAAQRRIEVARAREDGALVVQVDRRGRGPAGGLRPRQLARGWGLRIVRTLVEGELRGSLSVQPAPRAGPRGATRAAASSGASASIPGVLRVGAGDWRNTSTAASTSSASTTSASSRKRQSAIQAGGASRATPGAHPTVGHPCSSGDQAVRTPARALRRVSARRSSSLVPPQTPASWPGLEGPGRGTARRRDSDGRRPWPARPAWRGTGRARSGRTAPGPRHGRARGDASPCGPTPLGRRLRALARQSRAVSALHRQCKEGKR
jgi:two-component sensor histidine kinase